MVKNKNKNEKGEKSQEVKRGGKTKKNKISENLEEKKKETQKGKKETKGKRTAVRLAQKRGKRSKGKRKIEEGRKRRKRDTWVKNNGKKWENEKKKRKMETKDKKKEKTREKQKRKNTKKKQWKKRKRKTHDKMEVAKEKHGKTGKNRENVKHVKNNKTRKEQIKRVKTKQVHKNWNITNMENNQLWKQTEKTNMDNTENINISIQGGRQALDPSLKTRNGPHCGLLFGRDGLLWEVWGVKISTRDRRGTLISISFLGLSSPFLGSKNIKVWAFEKQKKSRTGSTKNACCLIHLVSRICLSHEEKCTSQNVFSKLRSPSFVHYVLYHLRQRVKKTQGIEIRFLGFVGPFWGWGRVEISVRDMCHKQQVLPRVVCLCGAVGVCGKCHRVGRCCDIFDNRRHARHLLCFTLILSPPFHTTIRMPRTHWKKGKGSKFQVPGARRPPCTYIHNYFYCEIEKRKQRTKNKGTQKKQGRTRKNMEMNRTRKKTTNQTINVWTWWKHSHTRKTEKLKTKKKKQKKNNGENEHGKQWKNGKTKRKEKHWTTHKNEKKKLEKAHKEENWKNEKLGDLTWRGSSENGRHVDRFLLAFVRDGLDCLHTIDTHDVVSLFFAMPGWWEFHFRTALCSVSSTQTTCNWPYVTLSFTSQFWRTNKLNMLTTTPRHTTKLKPRALHPSNTEYHRWLERAQHTAFNATQKTLKTKQRAHSTPLKFTSLRFTPLYFTPSHLTSPHLTSLLTFHVMHFPLLCFLFAPFSM